MPTLTEAAEQIRTRKLSPVELTQQCLARVERLDRQLNAFITVMVEPAMQQAEQAEREVAAGKWRGPLHGIPIALKDLFDVNGVATTAASNQYRDRIAAADAEIVARLKQSGAVILGKTNMHEFAFGMSGFVSAWGPSKNPWDTTRITGGSSSGSAAAVAAGLCIAAFGSDTGGSIRCPAALCSIVGHRPSFGVFSLDGVVPLSPSFDTVGPMTQTVRDAAVLSHALLSAEPSALGAQFFDPAQLDQSVSGFVVGVPQASYFDDVDGEVKRLVEAALGVIRGMIGGTREVPLPAPNRGKVFSAEIYEYHEAMVEKTPGLYQPDTLARVRACAGVSATDYIRTQRHLAEERMKAMKLCEGIDALITPTTHVPAPTLAELAKLDPMAMRAYETSRLLPSTAPFSALCWPAVSVPCGFTSAGLPVGLQIAGIPGSDGKLLRLAHAYEQATAWHSHRAPL